MTGKCETANPRHASFQALFNCGRTYRLVLFVHPKFSTAILRNSLGLEPSYGLGRTSVGDMDGGHQPLSCVLVEVFGFGVNGVAWGFYQFCHGFAIRGLRLWHSAPPVIPSRARGLPPPLLAGGGGLRVKQERTTACGEWLGFTVEAWVKAHSSKPFTPDPKRAPS